MLVDWFTVGAQVLNFVILVWLMRRFLYQPVLDAIAARELKIAEELAGAAASRSETQKQHEEFRQKNKDLDEQRADLLRQARDAANAERELLRTEARTAADVASAALAKALLSDAQHLRADMTRQLQDQVFAISRQVLGDLASVSLEQQACEVFIRRLRAIEGAAKATLREALRSATHAEPASVRSAFELPQAQRAAIQAALDEAGGEPIALRFETAPDLVSGIALSVHGHKLAWSISDYLDTVSSGLTERLRATEPA